MNNSVFFFCILKGKLNKMVITLAGSEKVDTSSLRLQLINTEGNLIRDVPLQNRSGDGIHFTAIITPAASKPFFKLKLKGSTQSGNPFERISHQVIKPTTAVLRAKRASNDYTLPLRRNTFIHFQLCNFGNTEIFNVAVVKDRLRYIDRSRLPSPKRVIKGRCVTIAVRARATRQEDVETTDSVFVIAKGNSSSVVVSETVRLFVVS